MKVIGITGGVGAGKSAVLDFLQNQCGAYVVKADEVGHKVMEPGQKCYDEIIRLFGEKIVKDDKSIDRKAISDVVFSETEKLAALNAIVHPTVRQYIMETMNRKLEEGCSLFIVESAILLEVNYQEFCDFVWYIYTNPKVRAERLQQSRGYSLKKIEEIIANQPSDEYYRSHTDYVIDNSNDFESTSEQIRRGLEL
ncbi:MAG: dephospho-CoA kinase [Eubacteriales bacterium]|nr:dephospho-CoA kinase [Eubacteriales bacterium]